jgi:hypothetical protein
MNRIRIALFFIAATTILGHMPGIARVQEHKSIVAGKLVVEPPTLISLGFEWYVNGNANRNASVSTSYRKRGETNWREGSAAIDAGGVLSNIMDGYAGKAPDLGAYEMGEELPHYGPRYD